MLAKHKKFLQYLRDLCLDIRETRNGRWFDQKVTPDVMSAVCDVIISYLNESERSSFSGPDLIKSGAFEECAVHTFGKPSPKNPRTDHEYDKFVGQQLNVLMSAGLLKKIRNKPAVYEIVPEWKDILVKMAGNEQEAIEFLFAYASETCKQSGLAPIFDDFFDRQDQSSFLELKGEYAKFVKRHTPIQGDLEPNRVFTKVVNIQAYSKKKRGAIRGNLSPSHISLYDLRYNRINFRDAKNKQKHVPRKHKKRGQDVLATSSRHVQRVIQDVKNYHKNRPGIEDAYSTTDPNSQRPVEGHHIFPKGEYEWLADVRENIMLLTHTQHRSQAHNASNLLAEPAYQLVCLIKKLEQIKECEQNPNCNFYSFDNFKLMLLSVGILDAPSKKQLNALSYDDVLRGIVQAYSPKSLAKSIRRIKITSNSLP